MNQNLTPQDNRPTVETEKGKLPDLDTMKSLYYWLNAKPDSTIKLLKGKRRINLASIRSVNERIVEKLENHNIVNNITSLNFVLSDRKILQYGVWAEFDRENWDTINSKVISISMTWDFTVQLPNHALPQKHVIKLQIGDELSPKDIFSLMSTSDDMTELKIRMAYGTIKVDFINHVLANELINIVDNWYEGLPKLDNKTKLQNFLEKYKSGVFNILGNFFPITFIFTLYSYVAVYGEKDTNTLTIDVLLWYAFVVYFLMIVGVFCGRLFVSSLDKRIKKLSDHSGFIVTNGDKNHNEEVNKKNQSLTTQIILRVILGLASGVAAGMSKGIFENFFDKG